MAEFWKCHESPPSSNKSEKLFSVVDGDSVVVGSHLLDAVLSFPQPPKQPG